MDSCLRKRRRATMVVLAMACLTSLTTNAAMAGTATGTINPGWNIYGDGNMFFFLSGPNVDPVCSIANRWAFDTTTPVGRSMYAALLAAYAQGKSVTVNGSATCIHSNTEAVSNIYIND